MDAPDAPVDVITLPSEIWEIIHGMCTHEPVQYVTGGSTYMMIRRVCTHWSRKLPLPNITIKTLSLARLSKEQIIQRFQNTQKLVIADTMPLIKISDAIARSGPSLTHISLGKSHRGPQRDCVGNFYEEMDILDDSFRRNEQEIPKKKEEGCWSLSLYQYVCNFGYMLNRVAKLVKSHNIRHLTINTDIHVVQQYMAHLFECPSLKSLEIVGFQATGHNNDDTLISIAKCLETNTTLKCLSLQSGANQSYASGKAFDEHSFQTKQDGVYQCFKRAFEKNTTLRELNVDSMPAPVIVASSYSKTIRTMRIIWLGRTTVDHLADLVRPLRGCTALENMEISLRDLQMDLFGNLMALNGILATLQQCPPDKNIVQGGARELQTLVIKLSGTPFDGSLIGAWADQLCKIIVTHPKLRHIVLPIVKLNTLTRNKLEIAMKASPFPRKLILNSDAFVMQPAATMTMTNLMGIQYTNENGIGEIGANENDVDIMMDAEIALGLSVDDADDEIQMRDRMGIVGGFIPTQNYEEEFLGGW